MLARKQGPEANGWGSSWHVVLTYHGMVAFGHVDAKGSLGAGESLFRFSHAWDSSDARGQSLESNADRQEAKPVQDASMGQGRALT